MRNFVFDLYGTLIDILTDEGDASFRESYSRLFCGKCGFGADFWETYDALCAPYAASEREPDLLDIFRIIASRCGSVPQNGELLSLAYAFRTASRKRLRLYGGVMPMLYGLKERGARLYILSNAQSCFTVREIEETGIGKFFDGILLSSDCGYKKPSRKIFDALVERYGLDRARSIYIGNDFKTDVLGSVGAGFVSAYIRTYNDCNIEEAAKYADFIASDHVELTEKLFALADEK